MTEVKMDKSTEMLASLVYTRDSDGQVKKTTSKGLPGAEVTENTYDENNRLTKYGSTEYKYDSANNPTKEGSSTNTYQRRRRARKRHRHDVRLRRTRRAHQNDPRKRRRDHLRLRPGRQPDLGRTPRKRIGPEIKDSYAYNGEGLRTSQTITGTTSYLAWDMSEELPLILSDGTNSYIYGPGGAPGRADQQRRKRPPISTTTSKARLAY